MALQSCHFKLGPFGIVGGTVVGLLLLSARHSLRMTSSYTPGSTSVVYITAPSEEVASKLARALVHQKMAACVNIIPKVTSVYEWEGKLTEDTEVLMMIKTRASSVHSIVDLMKKEHPYDCPEVISVPIEDGSPTYLKWVQDSVPKP